MKTIPLQQETLIRAFQALGKLVASEYPSGYTLTEIVGTWGDDPYICLSTEDVDAIRAVEEYLDRHETAPPQDAATQTLKETRDA